MIRILSENINEDRYQMKDSSGNIYVVNVDHNDNIVHISRYAPEDLQEYYSAMTSANGWDILRYNDSIEDFKYIDNDIPKDASWDYVISRLEELNRKIKPVTSSSQKLKYMATVMSKRYGDSK